MEVKILQIVNFEKFRDKILELGNISEIAKRIGVVPSAISNWIGNARRKVKSEYIRRLQSEYKLTLEDLGAEEVKAEKPNISVRLEQLLKENNINKTYLAKTLGIANSDISQWKTEERKPKVDDVLKIAYFFDVSIEYLLGLSNIKNIDNEEMMDALKCSEYLLNSIKDDNENALREFMGMEMTAKELGEKYFNLKDFIFGNPSVLSTLKAECDRVINYYLGGYYYRNFEETINVTDICSQSTEQPVRYEIEQLAHANINKAISRVFDKYVNDELTKIYKKDERFKNMYLKKEKDIVITKKIKKDIGIYEIKKIKGMYKKIITGVCTKKCKFRTKVQTMKPF